MKMTITDIPNRGRIPSRFAFCAPDAATRVSHAANRNPGIAWDDVPDGTRSLVLVCVDRSAPSSPVDVNKEGREVPADLPRADFYHWTVVDLPPTVTGIAEGACSDGVTARGKRQPPGPAGTRQGRNDYTGWFAGDADMEGEYFGYDGPCPPWNDAIEHEYHFVLYATDLARCPVDEPFTGADVVDAVRGHVLAEARVIGLYSTNPALDGR